MGRNIGLMVGGLMVFILALIMLGIASDTAATTGALTSIASFTGLRSINNLYPLIFGIAGIVVGLAAMGLGGAGAAGYGPMGRRNQ